MSKKKNKKEYIRKVINIILLVIAIILVCIISLKLYRTYQKNLLSESVLTRTVGTIQYNDFKNAKREFTGDTFVLISYLESKETRNLEENLKKTIVDNNLQTNFYYLDATDLMLEDNYLSTLNDGLELSGDNSLNGLPAILYYKDGALQAVLSSKDGKMITDDDFVSLLKKYKVIESAKK